MFSEIIAKELGLKQSNTAKAIELLDEGNTIPFIARYRKEATGEMDENQLRELADRLTYLRNLTQRKEEVQRTIEEQGKWSAELASALNKAKTLAEVEDIYLPYRPKRKTRASQARERGLEPLARIIRAQEIRQGTPEEVAAPYVNPEKEVPDAKAALQGALDIIAEEVAEEADIRRWIREFTFRKGVLQSKAVDSSVSTAYDMYYDYQEPVAKIPPHRVLAINRGEREKVLKVKIEVEGEAVSRFLENRILSRPSIFSDLLKDTLQDSYKRLLAPAMERELRNEMTEKAEEQAMKVFQANLKNLLMQPPIGRRRVLSLDPGFRTGCKWAALSETGSLAEVGVIYPHEPQKKWDDAKRSIRDVVKKYGIELIAIGNGTASRETEALVAETIRDMELPVQFIIVSEAGASVYSASPLAGEEFPQFDLSLRSAVSIGRRLQDPLAELVKIEPKALGVGQYQHDMNQKRLEETLGAVVESCVNTVGVDLNTASPSLLRYVAGVSPQVAKNIVAYREEKGPFRKRAELKKVSRLGPQAFQQCAGFVRIPDGDNPLENTPVHPESYDGAATLLKALGFVPADIKGPRHSELKAALSKVDAVTMSQITGLGVPTLKDIIEALMKPGRDPREDLPKPRFSSDILSIENLKEGMILQGTVRNVVDFGAFVDIGVKHDGLVHISQLADKFIRHPMEVVAVGDIVTVAVLSVDRQRERVGLTMKGVPQQA
ncbi:RNA-binding transcriptional accessory protein [Heliobacterium chlorum]|uniref:RNA-binding transcriptional accessory protein n=1 Tax=Heliobacterium chlorum TaxID=2698 RepID=A0ABR7SWK3_HELCL|nr:Tex family protein [Heliobacterium chlorum]MBC9782943.1 RNA-binding transcriptional accessory protein [Heliobacterium chlorum]